MQFIKDSQTLCALVSELHVENKLVGLVPTMGNLHAGHMQLITQAKTQCDFVFCTIFVNPLQFGPSEDLDAYPRTLDADRELLEKHGCDALFAPRVEEIYGSNMEQQTTIHVPVVSENYCGSSRPGHFDGVATVVCKLLNLVGPDIAFFGLKDYQQFLVIKKMVADLSLPIQIAGVETVRERSGLAMSSRNGYLDQSQKDSAAAIYASLQATADALHSGNKDFKSLEQKAINRLQDEGLRPDYFAICHAETLQAAKAHDTELVILAAAFVGPSRLIDNLRLNI